MGTCLDFYIPGINGPGGGGPIIFSKRLKSELEKQGLRFSQDGHNVINIITGEYEEGKNNILRLDGLYLDSNNTIGDSNEMNKLIFKSYDQADHIIFQSIFSKLCYESFTGKIKSNSIIANGVPEIFFEDKAISKPRGFDKVVIASAQWRRHKRLEEIIQAFKHEKLKRVALVILGLDSDSHGIRDVENIFRVPLVDTDDLPQFYQMADAMIHIPWIDWCPNTVVEGLASRLPVLCSHNGGTKELVGKDGIILKIEEDYEIGSRINLYNPPDINIETVVQGVLDILDMPKINTREDLKISNVANFYKRLFK